MEDSRYHYIMVTHFEKHWDELSDRETSYPLRMLKGETTVDITYLW